MLKNIHINHPSWLKMVLNLLVCNDWVKNIPKSSTTKSWLFPDQVMKVQTHDFLKVIFHHFSWKIQSSRLSQTFFRHFKTFPKSSNSSWLQFIINPVYIIDLMLWLNNIFECKNIKNDNYLYWGKRKTLADFDHDQKDTRSFCWIFCYPHFIVPYLVHSQSKIWLFVNLMRCHVIIDVLLMSSFNSHKDAVNFLINQILHPCITAQSKSTLSKTLSKKVA